MFGYIRPYKPELKICEFETYKAVYCGLCDRLGKSFGPLARLTLSYDFTFLSMVYAAVSEDAPAFGEKRCGVNPFRKKRMCLSGEAVTFGADIAALMIYHKLLDNIQDSGFLKGAAWRLLLPFARSAYKKAVRSRPEAANIISAAMEAQKAVEDKKSIIVDEACEPSAAVMEGIFGLIPAKADVGRVLRRLGYLVGRFVYLCDALDDFEDDVKTGNYNPFVLKHGVGNREALLAGARESLYLTAGEAAKAYSLLDAVNFGNIIENVTHMGLRAGAEEILTRKEKGHGREKIH